MSGEGVLGSGKDFDDLTDEELAALEAHDWTEGQIMAALRMALQDGAMEAAADLIGRLSRKNPRAAALLVEFAALTAANEDRP